MPPRHELSPDDVGALVESINDPLLLHRQLERIAGRLPDLTIPAARRVPDHLIEALRRMRVENPRPSPVAQRRYQVLEQLLVRRLAASEIAATEHVSARTLYRWRHQGLVELAPVLEQLWREAEAAPARGLGGGGAEPWQAESIPATDLLVGRVSELEDAIRLLATTRLLVIGGPAGIGKTTFAATVARQEAAARPVLWHRLRTGLTDSVGGVLVAIGDRLSQLGADSLLAFMQQASISASWQALAERIAAQLVQQHGLTMVFDDGDAIAGNIEVCNLLASLHSAAPSCRIVVTAREQMPHLVEGARLELRGLSDDEVRTYLVVHELADLPATAVETLVSVTGGSPQLLHLAVGALRHGEIDPQRLASQLLDTPDLQAFFFNRIYRLLTEPEQLLLGAGSLLRRPAGASFLAAALDGLVDSTPSTLARLGQRFLFTVTPDGLRLHSSVREFARRMLSPGDTRKLHVRFATAYERAGILDEACHHWLEAGDTDNARRVLLLHAPAVQPHVRTRLQHLVERLLEVVGEDDPAVVELRALHDQVEQTS